MLSVETGSSNISIDITLTDPNPKSEDGRPYFVNNLKTFGGLLLANITHANSSRPSTLYVKAENSIDPVQLFVDSKFQGTYDVHTSLSNAVVQSSVNVPDPSGRSRTRVYDDDLVTNNRRTGWAGWGSRPPQGKGKSGKQGHIEVASSLSPAVLQLTAAPETSGFLFPSGPSPPPPPYKKRTIR